MIPIRKPEAPPRLLEAGKKKRRAHCTAYTRNPVAYQSGEKTFTFDRSIYAHESVKQVLIAAQHGKCCFCERKIGTDGDVEHFRPKQAVKQAPGEPLQRPGYYWLAYDWDNLYLACTGCNQRHKQNLFPLENPDDRATDHKQSIEQERPLFIDPGKEDPQTWIEFRGEWAYAIDGNARGTETIDLLRLNRLSESRRERLGTLKALFQLVQQAPQRLGDVEFQHLVQEAKVLLEKAVQDDAEFAAAARSAIESNFRFVLDIVTTQAKNQS